MRIQRGTDGGRIAGFTLIVLVAELLLGGCATTRSMTGADAAQRREKFNEAVHGERVRITLADGTETDAIQTYALQDTLHWRVPQNLSLRRACFTDVRSVAVTGHGGGVGRGLGVGALTGGLMGATIGFAGGDDPDGIVAFSAGDKAGLGLMAGAVAGGLVGAIVGGISGTTFTYEFAGAAAAGTSQAGERTLDGPFTTDP